jgi:hypothetical protein
MSDLIYKNGKYYEEVLYERPVSREDDSERALEDRDLLDLQCLIAGKDHLGLIQDKIYQLTLELTRGYTKAFNPELVYGTLYQIFTILGDFVTTLREDPKTQFRSLTKEEYKAMLKERAGVEEHE